VKVSAAEEDFGTYKVTTTTNTNDTATWDYSATSATKNYQTGDVLTGGVVLGAMGDKATKGAAGYLDVYTAKNGNAKGGVISFPVPTNSAGTFTLITSGDQSTRCLYLNDDSSKTVSSVSESKGGSSMTFTAADITDGHLVFAAYETNSSATKATEIKIVSVKIVLTTGEFEATAELVNVTFHDGDSVYAVEEVAKGSAPTTVPTKWGYDFAGVYSDAELTAEASLSTVVNEATDLYIKWNPWAESVIADKNTLDFSLIDKGTAVWGTRSTGAVNLTGTSYSMLAGSTAFAASKKACGDLGTSENAIKTGGSLSVSEEKNGIILHASNSGKLSIWARSGSSDKSVIVSVLGSNDVNLSTTNKIGGTDATLVEIDITAADDYYIGSTEGSLYIHYISFVADPVASVELYQERVAVDAVENIRLVAVVENVKNLSDLSLVLKCDLFAEDMNITTDAKIANRITNNGETYSLGEISFEAKDGVVYIKCVIAADSKYVAETFTAVLTVGGITKTVTINALA
ncbi:MAG: hypothetical protein K2H06_04385, partial [Anaeroplasmataceae bacterium]|nr:hypothetical protein [Anaeroplasmataceae bacterium]